MFRDSTATENDAKTAERHRVHAQFKESMSAGSAALASDAAASATMQTFPKIVWMFWSQGKEQMLAKRLEHRACYSSWVRQNSGWEVRVVDADSIAGYIGSGKAAEVAAVQVMQAQSDLVRLAQTGKPCIRTLGGVLLPRAWASHPNLAC
jgi:hypothetical protein